MDSVVTYNELLKHWSEKKLERMPYEKLTPRFGHQPVHPMQFKVQELMTSCPVKAAQAGKWVVSASNLFQTISHLSRFKTTILEPLC